MWHEFNDDAIQASFDIMRKALPHGLRGKGRSDWREVGNVFARIERAELRANNAARLAELREFAKRTRKMTIELYADAFEHGNLEEMQDVECDENARNAAYATFDRRIKEAFDKLPPE